MNKWFRKSGRQLAGVLLLWGGSLSVWASDSDKWQAYSEATASWLWMDVYQAKLYSRNPGLPANFLGDGVPLKLELCYFREVRPKDMIEAANSRLPSYLPEPILLEVLKLHSQYRKVDKGDCYSLEATKESRTVLKLNGQTLFTTDLAGFKTLYFGIWLGDNPLSNELKQQLLKAG